MFEVQVLGLLSSQLSVCDRPNLEAVLFKESENFLAQIPVEAGFGFDHEQGVRQVDLLWVE
jgi:hypothetical protein